MADKVPHRYKSVHDYMDALFDGRDPSTEDIIYAKKQYWKSYNLDLIQRRRAQKAEFTINLSKYEVKLVQDKLTKEKSITAYIKRVFLSHLMNDSSQLSYDTSYVAQQLFEVVNFLDDLRDNSIIKDMSLSAELDLWISKLEALITTHFDN